MKFCIATVLYWQQHGFNTTDWRKSVDNTQALIHLEYAKLLVPNIEADSSVTIYDYPSTELDNLLNSSAWAVGEQ